MTDANGKLRVDKDLAVQAVVYVAAVVLAYGMVKLDVAVLQTKYEHVLSEISELKTDVKELLRYERSHQH